MKNSSNANIVSHSETHLRVKQIIYSEKFNFFTLILLYQVSKSGLGIPSTSHFTLGCRGGVILLRSFCRTHLCAPECDVDNVYFERLGHPRAYNRLPPYLPPASYVMRPSACVVTGPHANCKTPSKLPTRKTCISPSPFSRPAHR
jgi:hypothetical protein